MGTALASFVAGALIVFTMFDETQVTKVDALQGSIREMRKEAQSCKSDLLPEDTYNQLNAKIRKTSTDLTVHLKSRSLQNKVNKEHYAEVIQNMTMINKDISGLKRSISVKELDQKLEIIEKKTFLLTKQTPYTLLMMRIVEIGLPVLLSIFSVFFLIRYSLTEKRSHEIKDLLKQRNLESSI